MLFCEALDLPSHALIAAVGAGGKTSILQHMAAEMAAKGACVISTTTTAIWEPSGLVAVGEDRDLLVATAVLLSPGRVVTAAGKRSLIRDDTSGTTRTKLLGIPADLPGRLLALPNVDYVLVEADGARGRPIKAPAGHEPVIPTGATHVLCVVGIDALGQPLCEEIAHRPEHIASLLHVAWGTLLTPDHIAALLAHPRGGRKGVPTSARFVPFINKVQDEALLDSAREIAQRVRGQPGIDRVLIGAALSVQPVWEIWQ